MLRVIYRWLVGSSYPYVFHRVWKSQVPTVDTVLHSLLLVECLKDSMGISQVQVELLLLLTKESQAEMEWDDIRHSFAGHSESYVDRFIKDLATKGYVIVHTDGADRHVVISQTAMEGLANETGFRS